MVLWGYPPTRRQLAATTGLIIAGVALMACGAHLSMVNVGPQQARTKARTDFVKASLRRWLDD